MPQSFPARIMIIVAVAGVVTWLLTTQGVPQASVALDQAMQLDALRLPALGQRAAAGRSAASSTRHRPSWCSRRCWYRSRSRLAIDPIHFGIVMTVNLAIGMFTPPFGLNIFVAQSVTGLPAHTLYRGVAPFVAVLVLALLIITYVPALSLTLGSKL